MYTPSFCLNFQVQDPCGENVASIIFGMSISLISVSYTAISSKYLPCFQHKIYSSVSSRKINIPDSREACLCLSIVDHILHLVRCAIEDTIMRLILTGSRSTLQTSRYGRANRLTFEVCTMQIAVNFRRSSFASILYATGIGA